MNIQGLLGLVTVPKWRQRLGDITTPKKVVDSLLGHLTDDPVNLIINGETIVDPCCGHGSILIEVARLAKEKIDPKVIAQHLYGYDINHAETAKKLLANELGIDPKFVNIYQEDSLGINMDAIKNFRVVMNPPFNEEPGESRDGAGNSNNSILYQEFVKKFAGKAKQVVSLNPAGWTIKKSDVDAYKKMGLKEVEFLPASHFPTVMIRSGLTIANFVKDYNSDITVTTMQGDRYDQPRTDDIKNISTTTHSILNKLRAFGNLGSVVKNGSIVLPKGTKGSVARTCEIDPDNFSLKPTKDLAKKTLAFVGNGVDISWVWTKDACKYASKHKVVVSVATSKHFLGNVVIPPASVNICRNNNIILVKNKKQASLYKDYLDGPLVNFIIKNVKFNDVVNTKTNSWNYIPLLPIEELELLSNELKDDFDLHSMVYNLFGITDEERAYIENE